MINETKYGDLREEKRLLREKMRRVLAGYSVSELKRKSRVINEMLLSSPFWKSADVVFLYLSIEGEVDTWSLVEAALRAGKRVALPRVEVKNMVFHELFWEGDDFTREVLERESELFKMGRFKGIYEPTEKLPRIDICGVSSERVLVIVPGVAFDREKNRLGRGGGYYDRFVQHGRECCKKNRSPVFVALAFHFQVVNSLPVAMFDQRVDTIITEREVIG